MYVVSTHFPRAPQVVQEVFCWTRNPVESRRLATRKEALYVESLGERKPMLCSGVHALLDTLHKNNVPVALVSSAPEQRVHSVLQETGTDGDFETTICAEDVHRGRPDPECLMYASQRISRPPSRCVVIGMWVLLLFKGFVDTVARVINCMATPTTINTHTTTQATPTNL